MKQIIAGVIVAWAFLIGGTGTLWAQELLVRGIVYVTSEGEAAKNVVIKDRNGAQIPVVMDREGDKLTAMNKSAVEVTGFEQNGALRITSIRSLPTPSTIPPRDEAGFP